MSQNTERMKDNLIAYCDARIEKLLVARDKAKAAGRVGVERCRQSDIETLLEVREVVLAETARAAAVEPAPMGTREPDGWRAEYLDNGTWKLIGVYSTENQAKVYSSHWEKTSRYFPLFASPSAAGGVTGARECQHRFHDCGPHSETEAEHGCPDCGEWWARDRAAAAEQPRTVEDPRLEQAFDAGAEWQRLGRRITHGEAMAIVYDRTAAPEGSPVQREEAKSDQTAKPSVGGYTCKDCGEYIEKGWFHGCD